MPLKKGLTRQDAVKAEKMLKAEVPEKVIAKTLKVDLKSFQLYQKNKVAAIKESNKRKKISDERHQAIMDSKMGIKTDVVVPKKPTVVTGE